MAKFEFPRDHIQATIKHLTQAGAEYADIRCEQTLSEHLLVMDDDILPAQHDHQVGVAMRAFYQGQWGFAHTAVLTPESLQQTADTALSLAKSVSKLKTSPLQLCPVEPVQARYFSPWEIDPFTLPLEFKLEPLVWSLEALQGPNEIKRLMAYFDAHKRYKWFCSSNGSDIEQTFLECGAGFEVTAQKGNVVARRSYPNSHRGTLKQAGFECIKTLDLPSAAPTIQKEVLDLLDAPTIKPQQAPIVIDPTQAALQLHESCGHAAELDRALGYEMSFAGGSFLQPEHLGKLWYGSPLVNIVADATCAEGVGSFAYDDEGVPGQRVELVREGLFMGYLSSRQTASTLGLRSSGGAMRANGWSALPLIRMTNVNLEPGDASLEELIKDIDHGYLLSTNKSWSIDSLRLNFQFSTEIGWEIEKGKVGRMVRSPIYSGKTPEFWAQCSGIGGPADWQIWGIPNCGKGEPMQVIPTGHGSSYVRFENVQLGSAA